ncbi:hypothetical protein K438DRAFT_1834308 [Mycena galopus ATCC 62051]|nr:hypothetical protein K438DRAFT_1834308 [Mycena galopus ATCC 62051]
MTLKPILLLGAVVAVGALSIPIHNAQMPFDMPVFTATRVYKTVTDTPPYIVTRTTTMTWTQSPTTSIPFPTGPGQIVSSAEIS